MMKEKKKTEELYQFLLAQQTLNPSDTEILWRLSRACHDFANLQNHPELKKKLIFEAREYATKALQADPNNFAVQKWAGITLSDIGEYLDIKSSITNAFVIRDHFVKAIQLNPNDPTSHHLLGMWCFYFADMQWWKKTLVTQIFATPPSSSYSEALECFLQAETLEPGFYKKNALMLAKTYMKLKDQKNPNFWLSKCVAMPIDTPDDMTAHEEAVSLFNLSE